MVLRNLSCATTIIVGTCLITLSFQSVVRADDYTHPGKVVEWDSKSPISVNVKAWPFWKRTDKHVGCPEYGSPYVDTRTSAANNGEFALEIPSELRFYTVVYCSNDFRPRVDIQQQNIENNTPVKPLPAKLISLYNLDAPSPDDVTDLAVSSLNELSYLYEVNPKRFKEALKQYANMIDEEGNGAANEVLLDLNELVARWSSTK